MTKDVLVCISGLHMETEGSEHQEEDPIEVLSAGTYYLKNGKHYILIEETHEGFQGTTKTTIKWKEHELLEVSKKGLSNVHMIFEKNKKNRCFYDTPYGQLNMGIFTTELWGNEQDERMEIHAEYALDINYEPLAECEIVIKVQPKNKELHF